MVAKYENDEPKLLNASDRLADRGIGVELTELEIMPNIDGMNARLLLKIYQQSPQIRKALQNNAEHISIDI